MTCKGVEIGERSTVAQVRECLNDSEYSFDALDVYSYWVNKRWRTASGKRLSSVEYAVQCYSSFAQSIIRQRAKKAKRQQKKAIASQSKQFEQLEQKAVKTKKPTLKQNLTPPVDYKAEYAEQLKDPKWEAFRRFIFAVRGTHCEKCNSEKCIQVHHLKYIFGRKPWEYTCNEVVVLCRECHANIHNKPN